MTFRPVIALTLCALSGLPGHARAQSASVTGALIDHTTRHPIEGARINVLGTSLGSTSDASGRFDVAGVPAGVRVIQVRAIGYAVSSWMVQLTEGQVLRQNFEIEGRTITVDSVTVTAASNELWRSEAGFERRRHNGGGYFLTREEIQQRRANNITDLMRAVPGLYTACRGHGCAVIMQGSGRPCGPEYFLDGYPATFATGPTFPIAQIRGVEIYKSRSDVPAEFQRPGLNCGVIAIWTIDPGTKLESH